MVMNTGMQNKIVLVGLISYNAHMVSNPVKHIVVALSNPARTGGVGEYRGVL